MPTVLKKFKLVKENSETWLLNWLEWEMAPSPNAMETVDIVSSESCIEKSAQNAICTDR